jgi:hypothetical protein
VRTFPRPQRAASWCFLGCFSSDLTPREKFGS